MTKTTKGKEKVIKGITKTGFTFEIKEDVTNDFELVELLGELQNNNVGAMSPLFIKLLGDAQFKELKEHVRNESGTVQLDKIMNELSDMLEGNLKLKK